MQNCCSLIYYIETAANTLKTLKCAQNRLNATKRIFRVLYTYRYETSLTQEIFLSKRRDDILQIYELRILKSMLMLAYSRF